MVELQTGQLDSVFHALGDATRRRMLRQLAAGERTVGQLAEPFAISLAAASKHWTDRLDVLDRLLREDDARKSPTPEAGEDR